MKLKNGKTLKILDDKYYQIQLLWPVNYKGRTYNPMSKPTVKGSLLNELPEESVDDVKPI